MELFTTPRGIPSLWFELDAFLESLDDELNLEPLLRRAVDFKIRFASLDLGPSDPEIVRGLDTRVPEIIRSGLSLAQGLEEAAGEISYSNSHDTPPNAFSGFIAVSSETNAAVARCLYLTVRLHIVEMLSEVASGHHLDSGLTLPAIRVCMEPLLRDMTTALGEVLPHGEYHTHEEPGMGFRVFALFWPMMAVLRSTLADKSSQVWVQRKLLEGGTVSGFGLAVVASKGRRMGDESRAE